MRALGADIQLFAVHVPHRKKMPSDFEPYAQETRSIFPFRLHLLVFEHVSAAISQPRKYFSSLWTAFWGGGRLSLKDRCRTLLHWLEAPLAHKLFREAGVSHVHVHFLDAPASIMFFVNQIYGLAYSVTAHGSDIFVEKVLQSEKLRAASFTRVMTQFNRGVLSSVCTSAGLPPPKLALIPLGTHMSDSANRLPSPKVFTFLHVGRMVWQKGQRLLLEACRIVKSDGHMFKLVFVGDGELRPQITHWIDEMALRETVDLLGPLSKNDIQELYRSCHCFVLSSVSEGSPAVLIEAMAEGQPVIAPSLRGIPEMFTHGREGWLFETGSAASLAAAMKDAILRADELPPMGEMARLHAREHFDLLRNTQQFYLTLRGTIQSPSSSGHVRPD